MIGGILMKELIKSIRASANMNQEEFAKELGTTVASINRWENGKSIPKKLAQTRLYNFCQDHEVDLASLILKRKAWNQVSDKTILYHGSKNGVTGSIQPLSRSQCDFGKGFYMGTTTLQPLTLICSEEKPKFYTVELDMTGLKVLNVEIGLDWALLIAYYRKEMESAKGTEIYEKYAHFADGYDMIIGYIANDRMYTELTNFFNMTITDTALINCLSALDLGMQYVAVTQRACDQIKILKEETLSELELLVLKDMSIKRKKAGTAIAKEVELKYRREGKYFDEILRGE